MSAEQVARAPARPPQPTGGVWAPERRSLTVGLVLAVTLVAFEALAIATVLPVVGRHLGNLRLYGWLFSAFLLFSLIGIVLAGTLADRVPLWRPMLGGLALFAVGLVVGGTAPDMPVLVTGRAVQGLGAGVVPAVAYVVISRAYPENCRPRMFAVLSTAWVVPGLAEPAIAALVATAVGWRWVFLGLLPLVIIAGMLVVLAMRKVPAPARPAGVVVPYLPAAVAGAGAGGMVLAVSAWAVAGVGMGLAYAPLSVTTLDHAAAGEEGRATSGLQLCDVLGQALGTGVAGAIVATATVSLGHHAALSLAFSFAILISLTGLAIGPRLPDRLTGSSPTEGDGTVMQCMAE